MNTTIARRLGVLAAGASLALGGLVPAAQAATSSSAALGPLARRRPAVHQRLHQPPTASGPTDDPGLDHRRRPRGRRQRRHRPGGPRPAGRGLHRRPARHLERQLVGDRPRHSPSRPAPAPTRAAFGGLDLVALMEALIEANGRISGSSSFAVFGQALAAEGLSAAGSSKAPAVVSYLQALQCASGGFGNNTAATGVAPTVRHDGSTIARQHRRWSAPRWRTSRPPRRSTRPSTRRRVPRPRPPSTAPSGRLRPGHQRQQHRPRRLGPGRLLPRRRRRCRRRRRPRPPGAHRRLRRADGESGAVAPTRRTSTPLRRRGSPTPRATVPPQHHPGRPRSRLGHQRPRHHQHRRPLALPSPPAAPRRSPSPVPPRARPSA